MAITIPVLPSSDLAGTRSFYEGLGFSMVSHFPGEYLVVRHSAGIEIHFFVAHPGHDPGRNDHGCYIRFSDEGDCDRLYEQWATAGASDGIVHPPVDTDYGLREFAIIDPEGNQLRVGSPISR